MKQKPEHLPKIKKDELKNIVSVIQKKCNDVEMIILFGSYARGDYKVKSDLEPNRRSGHVSDYDILVVTEQKDTVDNIILWDEIVKACNTQKPTTHARIIVHDIQELNIKLAEGQYFFSDIKKEGYMLFDSGNFELADKRELTSKEQQRIARDYFSYWFKTAVMSYDDFQHDLKKGASDKDFYRKAAFNLHQAAESCYKTVLLVFTNYNPNEHWLALLSDMVVEEDSSFDNVFPAKTKEEKDRFTLLDYAYIGARYDPEYRISKGDLEILAISVKKLLELTENVCKQKIKSFVEKR
ncbi:MAG: HEPN domain-containing protein [Proteobacteria bacterium]|nr:HEPN domain-containing protein [Pseudomonadota bacterium]